MIHFLWVFYMSDVEKPKSLYRLSHELKELELRLMESNGEIDEETELSLSKLLTQSKEKVTDYCVYLDHIEAEREFITKQVNKANEYKASLGRIKARLEKMAMLALKESNTAKLEGFNGHFLGTRKSTHVEVFDKDLLPYVVLRSKTVTEPDKAAIKKTIEAGYDVPGARLVENINFKYK